MKLTLKGISDRTAFQRAGIALPSYDAAAVRQATEDRPRWVHIGVGNIFRVFIGDIADRLLTEGLMQEGVTCVEPYDHEVIDKIYRPFDNLMLSVILHQNGTKTKRVLAPFGEAIAAKAGTPQWERLKEVFRVPGLQLVSFTITEKGYALTGHDGRYLKSMEEDIRNGPGAARSAMALVAAMLYQRYQAGGYPLALVSMDNCSHNGEKLRESILTVCREWNKRGFVEDGFLEYAENDRSISFPWTMIDKITPRPAQDVADELAADGVEDMRPIVTDKKTFIAPFGNAEEAQYLVIEDNFPNGRPALEKAGVYMTSRETVDKAEKMKVNTCLNPIHTALCTYDCMLGYAFFADGMNDPELTRLASRIGYAEGLAVVTDPGILNPKDFLDEVVHVRLSNPFLGDTSQRIAVDISQMMGIRFGETIKSYLQKDGTAAALIGIPLAIVGWLRYLLAVDDNGQPFAPAPDPLLPELQKQLAGIELGRPESAADQLRPILSNANIFGVDLYKAGLGEKIEEMFREEIAGPGAVRATLRKYLGTL